MVVVASLLITVAFILPYLIPPPVEPPVAIMEDETSVTGMPPVPIPTTMGSPITMTDATNHLPERTLEPGTVPLTYDEVEQGTENPSVWRNEPHVGSARSFTTGYLPFHDLETRIIQIADANPDIMAMTSLGTTYEGRDIWALRVTDNPEANESDEPDILFMATLHGNEFVGSMATLALIEYIAAAYETEGDVREFVHGTDIWFLPAMNPDGYEWSFNGTDTRKTTRPIDIDDDGSIEGYGVDLNRNFPYEWGVDAHSSASPTSTNYHGETPLSEPESQALAFLADRERFDISLSFHSYGQEVGYPFGYSYDDSPDETLLREIGLDIASYYDYTALKNSDIYPARGDTEDYLHGTHGTLAYTIELGSTRLPGMGELEDIREATIDAGLYLLRIADDPQRAFLANWTVLIYAAADNSLGRMTNNFAYEDLNEMEIIGSTEDVNIVMLIDSRGDSNTEIFLARKDDDGFNGEIVSTRLDDGGAVIPPGTNEVDSSDVQTLQDFLIWGVDEFPSQRLLVDIWDHGEGLLYGLAEDIQTSYSANLEVDEAAIALKALAEHRGRKTDIVAYDMCYMAFVEFLWTMEPSAHYVIAAQDEVPDQGWDYDVMRFFVETPGMRTRDVAVSIVEDFLDFYRLGTGMFPYLTLSATSLAVLDSRLVPAMDRFAENLTRYMDRDLSILRSLRTQIYEPHVSRSDFGDLAGFALLVSEDDRLALELRVAALRVIDALEESVVAEGHSNYENDGAHGLSVEFPRSVIYDARYDQLVPSWTEGHLWDDFMHEFTRPIDRSPPVIIHTPLENIYDTGGTIGFTLHTYDVHLDLSTAMVHYSMDNGTWGTIPLEVGSGTVDDETWEALVAQGDDQDIIIPREREDLVTLEGWFPPGENGTYYGYYLEVSDEADINGLHRVARYPDVGNLSFCLHTDFTPPSFMHEPVVDQVLSDLPIAIPVNVTDSEAGVESVALRYRFMDRTNFTTNFGPMASGLLPPQGSLEGLEGWTTIPSDGGGIFQVPAPSEAGHMLYWIEADDRAELDNRVREPAVGYHSFQIIDPSATILLDLRGEDVDPDSFLITCLKAKGIWVDVSFGTLDNATLDPYGVLILSTNETYSPEEADALEAFVERGGSLLLLMDDVDGSLDGLMDLAFPDGLSRTNTGPGDRILLTGDPEGLLEKLDAAAIMVEGGIIGTDPFQGDFDTDSVSPTSSILPAGTFSGGEGEGLTVPGLSVGPGNVVTVPDGLYGPPRIMGTDAISYLHSTLTPTGSKVLVVPGPSPLSLGDTDIFGGLDTDIIINGTAVTVTEAVLRLAMVLDGTEWLLSNELPVPGIRIDAMSPEGLMSNGEVVLTKGIPYTFTSGTSLDMDGRIARVRWEVDNGNGTLWVSDSDEQVSFPETFHGNLTLTLVDNLGAVNSTTLPLYVNTGPSVDFNIPLYINPDEELPLVATVSDPDGIGNVTWRVGDIVLQGNPATLDVTQEGTVYIVCEVSDSFGTYTEKVKPLLVNARPILDVTISDEDDREVRPRMVMGIESHVFQVDDEANFDLSDSTDADGEVIYFSWTVDDILVSQGPVMGYRFFEPGMHTVIAEIEDDRGAYTSGTYVIYVNQPPAATMSVRPTGLTYETFDINVTPEFPGEVMAVVVQYGDGSAPGYSLDSEHIYIDDGTYTIQAEVTDALGGTSVLSITVTVENREPSPVIVSSGDEKVGSTIVLSGNDSRDPDGSIVRYRWLVVNVDHPDDSVEWTGPFLSVVFDGPGDYEARLIVEDDDGASVQGRLILAITDDGGTTPGFELWGILISIVGVMALGRRERHLR